MNEKKAIISILSSWSYDHNWWALFKYNFVLLDIHTWNLLCTRPLIMITRNILILGQNIKCILKLSRKVEFTLKLYGRPITPLYISKVNLPPRNIKTNLVVGSVLHMSPPQYHINATPEVYYIFNSLLFFSFIIFSFY